jgi:hypothetical protein
MEQKNEQKEKTWLEKMHTITFQIMETTPLETGCKVRDATPLPQAESHKSNACPASLKKPKMLA